ncbi:glycosyltransferase [Inquilinus sp. NPDC058860]|uniref:glycosyltransferase n=1 Tax=Inquilinus sp. NPDC058860 TaxID=3346652 RepID=UPI0036A3827C
MQARPAISPGCSAATSDQEAPPTPLIKVGMLLASTAAADGGVSEVVRELARTMHDPWSVQVDVLTLQRRGDAEPSEGWDGISIRRARSLGPRSFGYSRQLDILLDESDIDLLHVHGLWMYPSIAAKRWHRRTRRPYVLSPEGMLDPWALASKSWKKSMAMRLYEDAHLRGASCLHALNESEMQSIRALGYTAPICLVPNGVSPPPADLPPPPWHGRLPGDARVLLYLGRVTPKKGPAQLIRAWSALQAGWPAAEPWHLVFVGPGPDTYLQELQSTIEHVGVQESVHIVGPAYGIHKAACFGASHGFVLPSFSEGMPIAALEAWSHGLPTLLTPQCNLPEGFTHDAAIAIQPDVASITDGLRRLTAMTDRQRAAMGARGRALVTDRFSWPAVARQFEQVYRWLLGQQPPPDTIRLA